MKALIPFLANAAALSLAAIVIFSMWVMTLWGFVVLGWVSEAVLRLIGMMS